jgi:RNA recognition motif-containing protein
MSSFGYVEYENVDDAVRAVESSNQQVFQGRRLAVQFHRPRQPINSRTQGGANPPSKTLFIGNMSFEMSDKDLSDLFREVRNVIDVRIAIDRRTGQPRGFAHADFIDVASASKAMEFLKNKELYGRQLRVDYSLSTPRTPQRE